MDSILSLQWGASGGKAPEGQASEGGEIARVSKKFSHATPANDSMHPSPVTWGQPVFTWQHEFLISTDRRTLWGCTSICREKGVAVPKYLKDR
jgi:hypothetical protein